VSGQSIIEYPTDYPATRQKFVKHPDGNVIPDDFSAYRTHPIRTLSVQQGYDVDDLPCLTGRPEQMIKLYGGYGEGRQPDWHQVFPEPRQMKAICRFLQIHPYHFFKPRLDNPMPENLVKLHKDIILDPNTKYFDRNLSKQALRQEISNIANFSEKYPTYKKFFESVDGHWEKTMGPRGVEIDNLFSSAFRGSAGNPASFYFMPNDEGKAVPIDIALSGEFRMTHYRSFLEKDIPVWKSKIEELEEDLQGSRNIVLDMLSEFYYDDSKTVLQSFENWDMARNHKGADRENALRIVLRHNPEQFGEMIKLVKDKLRNSFSSKSERLDHLEYVLGDYLSRHKAAELLKTKIAHNEQKRDSSKRILGKSLGQTAQGFYSNRVLMFGDFETWLNLDLDSFSTAADTKENPAP
tara:strand:+ start:115 stop:1338 length:1224 start_codon:yes stop_codon:yes gene_type:complete